MWTEELLFISIFIVGSFSHLSGWFWLFTPNFGKVAGTYECCFPFFVCRQSGGADDILTLHAITMQGFNLLDSGGETHHSCVLLCSFTLLHTLALILVVGTVKLLIIPFWKVLGCLWPLTKITDFKNSKTKVCFNFSGLKFCPIFTVFKISSV